MFLFSLYFLLTTSFQATHRISTPSSHTGSSSAKNTKHFLVQGLCTYCFPLPGISFSSMLQFVDLWLMSLLGKTFLNSPLLITLPQDPASLLYMVFTTLFAVCFFMRIFFYSPSDYEHHEAGPTSALFMMVVQCESQPHQMDGSSKEHWAAQTRSKTPQPPSPRWLTEALTEKMVINELPMVTI